METNLLKLPRWLRAEKFYKAQTRNWSSGQKARSRKLVLFEAGELVLGVKTPKQALYVPAAFGELLAAGVLTPSDVARRMGL